MIFVVDGTGDIPDARYSATTVIDQQSADLAVLEITGDEQGLPLRRPVSQDRSPVVLAPPGPIGTQEQVSIFGYPVFGGEASADIDRKTIDVVRGQVRSFETGPGFGNITLIHIDATVSGGSSGGAVVDEAGQLVAIVTEARGGAAGGSAAVTIPVDRARPLLTEAGWVEPTATAAPPTSTPSPTSTPAPTNTSVPPTSTPVPPTSITAPTNTPVPTTLTREPSISARWHRFLLTEIGGSGVSGLAELLEVEDGTRVTLVVSGAVGDHPVHIHLGTCDEPGDIVVPLNDIKTGFSETVIDLSLDELASGEYAIRVHESRANIGTYVACGDIITG